MVLGLVRRISHSSLEKWVKTYLYAKYILMIPFFSTNASFCEEFSKIMTDRFEMSMIGELKYFLGFQIKQLEDGTFKSQTKYALDLLKKFGMNKAKPIKNLVGTNGHLDHDMGGKSIDQNIYRSMIGSLFYLCASRPNIMLSVCIYVQDFKSHPKSAI
jgi:hypothetical protein